MIFKSVNRETTDGNGENTGYNNFSVRTKRLSTILYEHTGNITLNIRFFAAQFKFDKYKRTAEVITSWFKWPN